MIRVWPWFVSRVSGRTAGFKRLWVLRVWVFIQWVVEMWVFTGVGFHPVRDKDVGVYGCWFLSSG